MYRVLIIRCMQFASCAASDAGSSSVFACPYPKIASDPVCEWGECVCDAGYSRQTKLSLCEQCGDGYYKPLHDYERNDVGGCEHCPDISMRTVWNGSAGRVLALNASTDCECGVGFWQSARVIRYRPQLQELEVEVQGRRFMTGRSSSEPRSDLPLCEDCSVDGDAARCLGGNRCAGRRCCVVLVSFQRLNSLRIS